MRRRLVTVVAWVVAVVGLVFGVFGADVFVRGEMEAIARREVAAALDLRDASRVDAEVQGGIAVLQLLLGRVEHVVVTVPDLEVGLARADLHAEIFGLPTNQAQPITRMYAYMEFDEPWVRGLAAQFTNDGVSNVELVPPFVRLTTSVRTPVDRTTVEVGVDVEPVMRGNEVVLRPAKFRVLGLTLTLAEFEQRFGVQASSLFDTTGFCVDDAIPSSLTIDDVRISNGSAIVVLGAEQLSIREIKGPHGSCGP